MMINNAETIDKSTYFMSNPEWYYYENDDMENFPLLTDKAPPEAVESYNFAKAYYEKQVKAGIYS